MAESRSNRANSVEMSLSHDESQAYLEFTLTAPENANPGDEYDVEIEAYYHDFNITDSAYSFQMFTKLCTSNSQRKYLFILLVCKKFYFENNMVLFFEVQ